MLGTSNNCASCLQPAEDNIELILFFFSMKNAGYYQYMCCRVQLAEDNMKLIVYTVSMENAGYYQCVAENTIGQVFAMARIVVFAHSKCTPSL